MENTRYDYSPITNRKPFILPNKAKVAFYLAVNIEHFDIGTNFGIGTPPNVYEYAPKDYGNRVGIWRLMEVLDKHNIKASVTLNSDVCDRYPIIIEEAKKRDWEFLGHGISNSFSHLNAKSEAEERQIISTTLDVIAKATGKRPKGWLGPALQETFDTPDILAEYGVNYVCDWCCDDQPFPMKVKSGNLISMPYTLDLNDIGALVRRAMTPQEFYDMVKGQFDTLYREGTEQARVMCVSVHPFLIGLPYRIDCLDRALQYIKSHNDVWLATSGEIANWYYENYT
ncbi:polysaccharide deacetylase family protein [Chloroflexota bacterium]